MALSNNNTLPKMSIVVPCYNEEEVLITTINELTKVLQSLIEEDLIAEDSNMLLVDDGSKDKTWEIISSQSKLNRLVTGLKLAKNAGHQNALLAGLMTAKDHSDCTVSIDADLQDDPNVIRDFIIKFSQGYDVVYGVRKSRTKDTFFKRQTAQAFYKLMIKMGVDIVNDHADFRLMSQRALNNLIDFKEVNLFLRGLVPLVGFKSTEVYYHRNERMAGESKYPLKKMLAFSLDGITSFSITPIRMVTTTGFILSFLSIIAAIYAIIIKITGNSVSGWSSLVLSIWFLGGIQLISLGLIGEYIGKIYKETKQRPRYFIEEHIE
ncbi:glycosyltransferase family 2 protein [Bacillus sp. UMB0893]|uniref:glycosyltransferase family 2 protein n=1 Tax=Bacillus sp. UMB0893 TaxID=2066053 RepID=UPI000C78277B|nr:glycosyltransferase family 2 protein [Bacillus sp. UMB0893]PLR67947.1 glycosyltransferase [Bacillus sp. UMB0893]